MEVDGTLLAAGGGPAPLVAQIALCFIAASAMTLVCQRARLPSIAGFVLAGLVLGPAGLGLVDDHADVDVIANLGLVFLLFLIGLEIDARAFFASGRRLLIAGLVQVPVSIAVGVALFSVLGAFEPAFMQREHASWYLGAAAAFSSALLVVKTLHERLQMDTLEGRICVGVLVSQDLWAVVILAIQPSLADPQGATILGTLAGVAFVVVVAALAARYVLPPAFRRVAKSPELVVILALGWCFGLGLLAAGLGRGADALGLWVEPLVSIELGALVAGASVASFSYAHEVVSKVGNLRDFFITLFFVALGMSLPVPDGVDVLVGAALLVLVTVGLRYLVFLPTLHWSGVDRRHATTASTKLAQVSELALVIAYLGLSHGHVDGRLVSAVVLAFIVTALLTRLLFRFADPLFDRIAPALALVGMRDPEVRVPDSRPDGPVRLVLLGFHRLASSMLHDIARDHPMVIPDTLVVDFNVALHDRIRSCGARVVHGDIADPDVLRRAGVQNAEVIVSTIGDDLLKGTDTLQLTRMLRGLAPQAKILVHAVRFSDVEALYEAGADYVFSWRSETSLGLLPAMSAALNGDIRGFLQARGLEAGETLTQRHEVLD